MQADYIQVEVFFDEKDGREKRRMLAVVHGNLAIHKVPNGFNTSYQPAGHSIDFNDPGWVISETVAGREICRNDFTPFYEAVDTVLNLAPIFASMPDPVANELLFDCWTIDNYKALQSIIKVYVDW